MVKRSGFQRKGKFGALAAHVTNNLTAQTSGIETVYFTWGMMSDAVRYTKVVDKLKEYVALYILQSIHGSREGNGSSESSCLCEKECPVYMY